MEKFYQVCVIESKAYNGDCKETATHEHRTRALTFLDFKNAVAEFEKQVQKARSVAEYAKRHKSMEEMHVLIDILHNGTEPDNEYWYELDYKDGELKVNHE